MTKKETMLYIYNDYRRNTIEKLHTENLKYVAQYVNQ